jgi:amidase
MRHSWLSTFGIVAALFSVSLMSFPAHASNKNPLMSISQALQAQANGSLTAVAIAQRSLAEIHRLNPTLKAFITVNPNLMSDAAKLDALRRAGTVLPLHGVTIAVKDNIDVAGMPTTGGSVLLAHNRPTHDADVVRRLRAAGALFVGKTNLDELAVAGSTISSLGGQTLNPYDTTRFAAGSSGGSAVSASTGISTCAIGTETVNSLRNAASSAGVVAVRPTHGLVSRRGVIPQSSSMGSSMGIVGPICRNIEDTVRVLEHMTGHDASDAETTANEGLHMPIALENLHAADLKGVRLGVLKHLFSAEPDGAPVNDIMQVALDKLRAAGAQIIPIEDPEFDSATSTERLNVSNYEFRPLFDAYLASNRRIHGVGSTQDYYDAHRFPEKTMGEFLKNAVSWRDPLHLPDYLAALQYTSTFKTKVLGLMDMQNLDALIYPSQKRPPILLTDKPRPERNGVFASAMGLPAVDLPAGFTEPTAGAPKGLPVGLDLLARPYDDMRLLDLAKAIETTLAARRSPPNL